MILDVAREIEVLDRALGLEEGGGGTEGVLIVEAEGVALAVERAAELLHAEPVLIEVEVAIELDVDEHVAILLDEFLPIGLAADLDGDGFLVVVIGLCRVRQDEQHEQQDERSAQARREGVRDAGDVHEVFVFIELLLSNRRVCGFRCRS